jgi:hypothetical protein
MALTSNSEHQKGSAKAGGHASGAWADDDSPQFPTGVLHQGDEEGAPADGLGGRVKDAPTSAAEADDSDPLFDRLARKPGYDFEALAAFFEEQSARQQGLLTGQQIAARWSRVQTYTRSKMMDAVADDLGASADWGERYFAGHGRQDEWHIPVRAAVGIRDNSAAALRPFDGIQGAMKSLG